ncbi:flagellar assembly protein FliW [Arthrobacter pityocampae]|uniref:Flagellar assembly protein FliW n=1 Tax=Arthrobacter pityocampae TaxID=547334 RepID=A0A2S5IUC8_9MICC|nr:flagellar assembly protein FliW [Arthrobacter pityocampae]PPB48151.1 flagellar assembly protein FliW [Arthrobacter pityocampae]
MRAAFVTPPPGLAPLTDFHLEQVQGADGLFTLTAAQDTGVRLFLLDAATYVPQYSPHFSDAQRGVLGPDVPDAHLFVVANPGPSGTTVNLAAPIVLDPVTGRCAQLILEGTDYSLRASLAQAA